MELAGEVGELAEALFSDDREVIGDELADCLALHAVAVRWCGPAHTHRRVEAKFNATSEKVGLRTRLQYYY